MSCFLLRYFAHSVPFLPRLTNWAGLPSPPLAKNYRLHLRFFLYFRCSIFKKTKSRVVECVMGQGGGLEVGSINPIKINLITVWLNYLEQVVDPFDIEWQQINKYFKLGYQNFTASIFIGFASENLIERRANLFSFFRCCCCCFFININKTMKKNTNKSN